jgi:hypothetical protein
VFREFNNTNGRWVVDSGSYMLLVGKDAVDAEAGTSQGLLTVEGD